MKRIILFFSLMLWAVPVLAFNYSSPDTPKPKTLARESATALPSEPAQEAAVNFKAESKKLVDAKSRPIDFKAECKKSASDVSKRDINRLSGQIKTQGEEFRKVLKGVAERAEKAEKDRNDVSRELVNSKGETTAAIKEHTKSNESLVSSLNGLKNDISGAVASVGRTEYYCGGIAILILGLGIFIYFRTKGTNDLVKEVGAKVDTSTERIIREVPKAVKTLDPEPFMIEVTGGGVKYWAPVEGIKEGFYIVLNIEDDDIETDPAKMRRKIKSKRGEAIHSLRGTMLKYFGGTLDAKTASLVDFLQNNGNDEIGKIEIIVL